jgi:hypothetical protein
MSMVYPLWLADLTGVKDQTIASMCCALKYTLVGAFKPWIFMTFHEKLGMECHIPTDEVHYFSEDLYHQPVYAWYG